MKIKKTLAHMSKKLFSFSLAVITIATSFNTSLFSMNVFAASGTVSAPSFNTANIPNMDTTGKVAYWYAGNEFRALNQLNGGVKQSGSGTNGHITPYSDTYGERMKYATDSDGKTYIYGYLGNGISNSDTKYFYQSQSDSFFNNTWELMDTDAVWDDDYLYSQFSTSAYTKNTAQTSAFNVGILDTVEGWYGSGFDGSGSYFSDAEKGAVKSAHIQTDGHTSASASSTTGTTNTTGSDSLDDAHLFAPSVDELFYNPVQTALTHTNRNSKDTASGAGLSQYARSYLWLRSFWGVSSSNGNRYGFGVHSTGAVDYSGVPYQFAVAPAFYLDLEKVVMAHSATSAASAAKSGFVAYDANKIDSTNGIKFLVQDSNFASTFTTNVSNKVANNVLSGDSYKISYTGAVTKTVNDAGNNKDSALVISAALYDSEGKIVYYGPLGNVTKASDSVVLTIPEGLEKGAYTLAVFEEQLGGTSTYKTKGGVSYKSYESDYQSGSVSYTTLNISDDKAENETGFDSKSWYEYKDSSTGITWNYKLDANGDIIGLYTNSSVTKIIDGGLTLNIPSKVNGRTVIGIGGGTEDTPVVKDSETGFTSISLPSTVTTVNDYAFYGTQAKANITIPETVKAVGIKAFFNSAIKSVKISDMSGAIGSYAFANTANLTNVTIKGDSDGLVISSYCFANSGVTDATIKGYVTVNKNAFRECNALVTLNINGNIKLNEYAFTDCTSISNLTINGVVNIGSYAFNNNTGLTNLYLPTGITLNANSFNGCTGITYLEADCNLVSNSFSDCGNISTLILDEKCQEVDYDWEGNSSTSSDRVVYIYNDEVLLSFYGNGGTYHSSFGSSGNVVVYVGNVSATDDSGLSTANDGVLKITPFSAYAHSGESDGYGKYLKGTANSVTLYAINSIAKQIKADGITTLKDATSSKTQTGIDAYYTGSILTTKDIDKNNMVVLPVYGSDEGTTPYTTSQFYVVRTTEFNNAEANGQVTDEVISSFEPVTATSDDLSAGQTTGTISVTVVVFYDEVDSDGNSSVKYYSTPVSIRVEEYSAESYIEQQYGSYEAIADKLVELENQIKELSKALEDADVDSVEDLNNQLNAYKDTYAEIVKLLEQYMNSNTITDGAGYFGTTTDSDGKTVNVVYIDGTACSYTDAETTTADGKKIYKTSYNGEEIYFYVDGSGIHVVDQYGADTGTVYKDTLAALERQAAAQLAEIKTQLQTAEDGLNSVVESLKKAGYDIDITDTTVDESYTQIVKAIDDLNAKNEKLSTDLENANNQIANYSSALETIYSKLTGSTLSADDITGISNILNAIVTKVSNLQNSLTVAEATVADLKSQLLDANDTISQLENELSLTKTELETAQNEKVELQAQYEKAIADGDEEAANKLAEQISAKESAISALQAKEKELLDARATVADLQTQIEIKEAEITSLKTQIAQLQNSAENYQMTVATANELFGFKLSDDASSEDVEKAIKSYIQDKLSADETIAQIQALINTTSTGSELVAEVSAAISNGSANADNGSTVIVSDDEAVQTAYENGYNAGVASVDTTSYYQNGYNEGSKSVNTTSYYNNGYNKGYSEGYSAGTSSNNGSTSSLTSQISSLNSRINTLTSDNSRLETENSNLNGQVSTLQSQLNSMKNASDTANGTVDMATTTTGTNNTATATRNTTTATKNESNSSRSKEDKNDKEVTKTETEEEEDLEGSTMFASTYTSSTTPKYQLGSYVERMLPNGVVAVADGQLATSTLNKLGDGVKPEFTSNAASLGEITDEQLANAYQILDYYSDNLEELGDLGSTEIKQAATNEQKEVVFDVLTAVDIEPSEEMLTAMENNENVEVTISSDSIVDGELYFIIHESTEREGTYDVILTKANGNELGFEVPDLSPVTFTKVTINTVKELPVEDEVMETPEVVEDSGNGGLSAKTIVLYVVLVLLIGGFVVFTILFKKRKLPFFK